MRNSINKNKPIESTYHCITCALNSTIKLFEQGIVEENPQDTAMRKMLAFLSEIDFHLPPPALGQEMHRLIRQITNNPDPYAEIKKKYNLLLMNAYPELKQKVAEASDPFDMALRLTIAGNIIDFGPGHSFDLDETIAKANSVKFGIDHSDVLRQVIRDSKTLLYLGDNAGEIVLDRIFLETIDHPNVYFAVRGMPIINDITVEDAQMVGVDKIAKIISNGDDAPGTILKQTSAEFQEIFEKADLVISKGQGNYESLCCTNKNIWFILMTKCNHVAEHLGVKYGDFIVKNGII